MKKILFMLALVATMFMASCTSCTSTSNSGLSVEWNLVASASGSGEVCVAYPTGQFTAKGDAFVEATTADTVKIFGAPADALTLDAALASENPEVRDFAAAVEASAFDVKTLKGEWHVDIVGYAKQPETGFYIVIDKHWPKVDSVAGATLVE